MIDRVRFRPLLLSWLLVACWPAVVWAQTPTEPVGQLSRDTFPRDAVIAKVPTLTDPQQQYSLYLPADYAQDKPLPLLIILDARGRGEGTMRMALEGARANGWIVMSSWQSRSDTLESVTLHALQALLDEAAQRFRYDSRRLYLAGFSGTAKTLWTQVEALHGPLAGMIGCGGGRPFELGPLRVTPPAFFGMAGTRDFNYQEMRDLDDTLAEAGAVHRLAIFDGGHGWPPDPAVFTSAIDWLQLAAMRDGREGKRPTWIDAQLAAARVSVDEAPDALERWRRGDQLARDFAGLRDVVADKSAAAQLATSSPVRQALSLEHTLRANERQHGKRFDAWRMYAGARDAQGRRQDPPSVARTLSELRIRRLQEQADGDDKARADSAARVLERDYVATAFYLPEQLAAQGDVPRAIAMLAIASAIFPGRAHPHWRRAQLLASDQRIDDAFDALSASRKLGYADPDDLRGNPVWQPLRDDPRWTAMLSGMTMPTQQPQADE